MGQSGADRPIVAMKRGNARGAKGVGHSRCCWVNGRPEELNRLTGRRQPSLSGTSRMRRESHVRICERLGVKFPGPTRRGAVGRYAHASPTSPGRLERTSPTRPATGCASRPLGGPRSNDYLNAAASSPCRRPLLKTPGIQEVETPVRRIPSKRSSAIDLWRNGLASGRLCMHRRLRRRSSAACARASSSRSAWARDAMRTHRTVW